MGMMTFQGERITMETGSPSLYTIGVSLGRIVRFTGHTKLFYTVLCHSLAVAEIMPPEIAVYGLMHDAQESLVSDVPSPMKTKVARNREQVLQRNIYYANGLIHPVPENILEEVEEADHKTLLAEAHILGHPGVEDMWGTEFDEWAGKATRKWLKRSKELIEPDLSGPLFERYFNKYYADTDFQAWA